jgi:hypothetical protein
MREGEQLSFSWTGTVYLKNFHIFTKKTVLVPKIYRVVSLTQGHQTTVGLQHYLPVQSPLSIVQVLSLLPCKIHSHILKGYQLQEHFISSQLISPWNMEVLASVCGGRVGDSYMYFAKKMHLVLNCIG